MNIFSEKETQTSEVPVKLTPKSSFKWFALAVGTFFGVAHIGVLGHLINNNSIDYPVIQFPKGDYSSYELEGNRDGYSIKYRANDPRILESDRSLTLDRHKKGFFGPTTEMRREFRRDQYTMDGTRNVGGAIDAEGKHIAKTEECIRADAGARSQGAMAGTAISTGLIAPAVANIPYIGWLAAGWSALLGNQIGSEIGSEVGSAFNDC